MLNSDAWAPKIPGNDGVNVREPVSGALSERLRRDSMCSANGGAGCETFYLGKPFPAFVPIGICDFLRFFFTKVALDVIIEERLS